MPFGIQADDELNPHLLDRSSVTNLPEDFKYDSTDCTGPTKPGGDTFGGRTGLFFPAPVLPKGQFHRFRLKQDTRKSCFNFTSEGTSLIGWLDSSLPERPFNQGNVGRIFVFAGVNSEGNPSCGSPSIFRPIRGCPTAYGWLIEIDSKASGTFDTTILFLKGP